MPHQVTIVEAGPNRELCDSFREGFQRLPSFVTERTPKFVVIKPNLCDIATWETGVTTDPTWLTVLAQELRTLWPGIAIKVVESDAISAYRAFRSCDETYDRLGFREIAAAADVELINLSREESWEVGISTFPEPLRIPALLFEDFFFVSVANVKLHPYERFTGVMKNNYGLLPQPDRSALHMRLPEVLFSIYQLCRTDLAILDGRIGLEGKGPIIGRPKRLNRLIMGTDALAVDHVACKLIGLDHKSIPHLKYASRQTNFEVDAIQTAGDTTPNPFVTDNPETNSLIIAKFAVRRFCNRFEKASIKATNVFFKARKNPSGFLRGVLRRLGV
jgi:uncharacterized protein (DUF362 family)